MDLVQRLVNAAPWGLGQNRGVGVLKPVRCILLPSILFIKQLERQLKVGNDLAATLLDSGCKDAILEPLGGLVRDAQSTFDSGDSVHVAFARGLIGIRGGPAFQVALQVGLDKIFQVLEELALS